MIFKFSALYPYLLDNIEFYFHLSPIFRLLPSKTRTMKKSKKDGRQFRASSIKEQKYCAKFNNSCCNKFKFIQKSLRDECSTLCTVCGNDCSIAHGGENDTNRHKIISKHKGYVDAAQRERKLINFGASSATTNLNQNVVKAEVLFSGFPD